MRSETENLGSGGGLRLFAKCVVGATFLLILAGGNVTSKGAGLAVPDWPTSFRSFNPTGWTSNMGGRLPGVRDEHLHRLVAGTIVILVLVLSVWLWQVEQRAWVRRLALIACLGVLVQAALGGLRVILKTQWNANSAIWFAVVHACVAQAFFCLTIAIAMALSPNGSEPVALSRLKVESRRREPAADRRLRFWTGLLAGSVYSQLILGALFRHTGEAVLGIVHVCTALVVGGLLIQAANLTMTRPESDRLSRLTVGLFLLYGLQVILGVTSYLSVLSMDGRNPIGLIQTYVPTLHVATGALILGTSFALAVRCFAITATARASAFPAGISSEQEVLA